MGVCAGITKSGTRITVAYTAADGTKGNSWTNPYTLTDIYDTAVAGGWSPAVLRPSTNVFVIPYSLYIEGATTYFLAGYTRHEVLILSCPTPTDVYTFYTAVADNIRIGKEGDGYTNEGLILYNDDSISPSGNRRVYISGTAGGGGAVVASSFINCYYLYFYNVLLDKVSMTDAFTGISTNAGTTIKDVMVHSSYYGWNAGGVLSCENLYIIDSTYALLISGTVTSLEVRNAKLKDTLYDTRVRCGNTAGKIVEFIDCEVDTSKLSFYFNGSYAGEQTNWQILKSTFNIYVKDENGDPLDGASVKLYAADDTLLLDQITVDGELTGREIEYYKYWASSIGGTQTGEGTIDYRPLKLVVSNNGYQDLEISGITITAGEQTNLYGQLELKADEKVFISTDGRVGVVLEEEILQILD